MDSIETPAGTFTVEESVMYGEKVASIENMWTVDQGEPITYVDLSIPATGQRVTVNTDHIRKLTAGL